MINKLKAGSRLLRIHIFHSRTLGVSLMTNKRSLLLVLNTHFLNYKSSLINLKAAPACFEHTFFVL